MDWVVTATQNEGAWLEDYIRDVIAHELPALPPHDYKVGHIEAHWHQVEPGVAYVAAHGGSLQDQILVESLLAVELQPHGYRRATTPLRYDHENMQKVAEWSDVEDNAKALVQSGGVQILRNGYNDVIGSVASQSKPGKRYQTEIKRDDPDSQVITGSHCGCDWGQFQNLPRTRQWKRFQDRPCKHIIATQWVASAVPIDEDRAPGDFGQQGQMTFPNMGPLGPSFAPSSMGLMQQRNLPTMQSQPNPWAQQEPMQAPSPAEALPQFPMDPSQNVQPQVNPISTPGGKDATPLNPIQYPPGPGGTFSSWRPDKIIKMAAQDYQNGDRVQLGHDDVGTLVGRSEEHGAGQQTTIPQGQVGEVLGTHPSTGMVNVLYMGSPWDQNGQLMPYGATAWHFPSSLKLRNDIKAPGPAIRRSR